MRAIDVVAWGQALGVRAKEIPWALTARIRQVEELHTDLHRAQGLAHPGPGRADARRAVVRVPLPR